VADGEIILGISSHWRCHVVLSPPMVSLASAKAAGMGIDIEDRTIRRIADTGRDQSSPPLGIRNSPPPQDWNLPGFDDLGWASQRGPLQADPFGTAYPKELSPEYGVVYGRFKFVVNDPTAVNELAVRVAFRGGLVAYLNRQEVARAALPLRLHSTGQVPRVVPQVPRPAASEDGRVGGVWQGGREGRGHGDGARPGDGREERPGAAALRNCGVRIAIAPAPAGGPAAIEGPRA
jgi:hypothetical protein